MRNDPQAWPLALTCAHTVPLTLSSILGPYSAEADIQTHPRKTEVTDEGEATHFRTFSLGLSSAWSGGLATGLPAAGRDAVVVCCLVVFGYAKQI